MGPKKEEHDASLKKCRAPKKCQVPVPSFADQLCDIDGEVGDELRAPGEGGGAGVVADVLILCVEEVVHAYVQGDAAREVASGVQLPEHAALELHFVHALLAAAVRPVVRGGHPAPVQADVGAATAEAARVVGLHDGRVGADVGAAFALHLLVVVDVGIGAAQGEVEGQAHLGVDVEAVGLGLFGVLIGVVGVLLGGAILDALGHDGRCGG